MYAIYVDNFNEFNDLINAFNTSMGQSTKGYIT